MITLHIGKIVKLIWLYFVTICGKTRLSIIN